MLGLASTPGFSVPILSDRQYSPRTHQALGNAEGLSSFYAPYYW